MIKHVRTDGDTEIKNNIFDVYLNQKYTVTILFQCLKKCMNYYPLLMHIFISYNNDYSEFTCEYNTNQLILPTKKDMLDGYLLYNTNYIEGKFQEDMNNIIRHAIPEWISKYYDIKYIKKLYKKRIGL